MSRGQTVTLDFTISIIIFIFVLFTMIPVFGYVNSQIEASENIRYMQSYSLRLSDSLMGEGSPRDWNESSVKSLGLSSDNALNSTKILAMLEMNYTKVRDIISINNYRFYFSVSDADGSVVNLGGRNLSYGEEIASPENVVKIQRITILNHSIVLMNIFVWD